MQPAWKSTELCPTLREAYFILVSMKDGHNSIDMLRSICILPATYEHLAEVVTYSSYKHQPCPILVVF